MVRYLAAFVLPLLAGSALAADEPVVMELGVPVHYTEPSGDKSPGSEWIRFPVKATNTSSKPVWLYGYALDSPFYSMFTRAAEGAPWTDASLGYCGTGAGLRELAPGATTQFSVSISLEHVGQQLRVQLAVRTTLDDTKQVSVSSAAVLIK
jgi:hypothetical protein